MSSFRNRLESVLLTLRTRTLTPSQPKLLASNYKDISNTSTTKLILQVLKILLKALLAVIILVSLLVGGTLTIMLGTIVSAPQIDDERLIVQRNTWPSGDAPIGEIVFGNKEGKPEGFLNRLEQELTADSADTFVAVVLAQPGDRVKASKNGNVIVNSIPTRFTSDKDVASILLTDDYLGICISGGCGTPGTPSSIPADTLIGSVQGKLTGIAISRYEIPEYLE